ncbi:MAG: hypothetical protein EBY17_27545 [Acidobacteriia bacterium]|nr:hypothetical protein [Terriglobia bacterium]
MTISGSSLVGATAVTLGGVAATNVVVASDGNSLTAVTPARSAGTASVLVTTPGGTNAANTLYTYLAAPSVNAISPSTGSTAGGQAVTITGTNFTGATSVTLGGATATNVVVVNATSITATTPAGTAGTASVLVTTPGGTNAANTLYTYLAAPTVSAISPSTGPGAGGQSVTLTGTNFTGATGVTLGGAPATSISVVNDTTITATTPASSPTAGILGTTGANPFGITIDSSGNIYTANGSSNNVTKITPAGVSTILGTTGASPFSITIDSSGNVYTANNGSNNVTKITPAGVSTILGTTGATPSGITIDSSGNVYTANNGSNNVTKITPAGVSTILGTTGLGPYGIVIDSGGNIYTANMGSDNVTKITPGGVSSILGTTGANPIDVTIDSGGNVYTVHWSSNYVTKITPGGVSTILGTTGIRPIGIVIDSGGNVYTANFDAANITKITPKGVSTILGTTGSGPAGIVIDAGGNVYTTNYHSDNVTKIAFPTPTVASVLVTTPAGTNAANTLYTYVSPPTISGISPAGGAIGGGQSVTISGSNLAGATAVTLGGVAATNVVVASDGNSLTAVTPARSAGTASVLVTTPGGTNAANTLYTYIAAPTVSAISPSTGSTAGGQAVTITGTSFTGATSVTLGGAAATNVVVVSATSITATTPAGTAGTATVVVNAAGGSATLTDGYTYVAVPTITGLSPPSGPLAGGTAVTITGTNLNAATGVTIGGVTAAITANTATSITVQTPAASNGVTFVSSATSAVVTAGADTTTHAAWRTTSVAKSMDADGNNSYGTDGYVVAAAPGTIVNPRYASVARLAPGTYPGNGGYLLIDNPAGSGSVRTGLWYNSSGSAVEQDFASITFSASIKTRVGVLVSNTDAAAISPTSLRIRQTTGGTADAGLIPSPTNAARNGDWYFFDVTAKVGDVFAVSGVNNPGHSSNGIGALTFDTVPNLSGPATVIVRTAGGSAALTGGYNYVGAPVIGSISPISGPLAGGTAVTHLPCPTLRQRDQPAERTGRWRPVGHAHGNELDRRDGGDIRWRDCDHHSQVRHQPDGANTRRAVGRCGHGGGNNSRWKCDADRRLHVRGGTDHQRRQPRLGAGFRWHCGHHLGVEFLFINQ